MTASTELPPVARLTDQNPRAAGPRATRMMTTAAKYLLILVFAFFFILPWAWMVSTSLKSPSELAVYPIVWIPDPDPLGLTTLHALRQANFCGIC